MNIYHIRYHLNSEDEDLVWHIYDLTNNKTYLVKEFFINVPVKSETVDQQGSIRWVVCCHGFMSIKNGTAYIVSE